MGRWRCGAPVALDRVRGHRMRAGRLRDLNAPGQPDVALVELQLLIHAQGCGEAIPSLRRHVDHIVENDGAPIQPRIAEHVLEDAQVGAIELCDQEVQQEDGGTNHEYAHGEYELRLVQGLHLLAAEHSQHDAGQAEHGRKDVRELLVAHVGGGQATAEGHHHEEEREEELSNLRQHPATDQHEGRKLGAKNRELQQQEEVEQGGCKGEGGVGSDEVIHLRAGAQLREVWRLRVPGGA
mmetsp:Transcript_63628/g.152099  ORF Transcript_63628/g.152099 Transcript_63628/m.152099 type:complete len:238 (+) Transcript_63628:259-972(+)